MRVTIAVLGCFFALMRAGLDPTTACAADVALSADSADFSSSEPVALRSSASECSDQSRVRVHVLELSAMVAPAAGPSEAPPLEETGVLWCVTPDDPRCAPIEGGTRSNLSFLREPLACALGCEIEPAIARSAARPAPAERMDDERDGVAFRIERPPRA